MGNWEYAIESINIIERWSPKKQKEELASFRAGLNNYGSQGWEMVSFETIPLTGGFTGNIKGYVYLTFFKRQLAG